MKHDVRTLTGRELDCAVVLALGGTVVRSQDGVLRQFLEDDIEDDMVISHAVDPYPYHYSWAHTGPLFAQHRVSLNYSNPEEEDELYAWAEASTPTGGYMEYDDKDPLLAGLRAFVASKIGVHVVHGEGARYDSNGYASHFEIELP